MPTAETLRALLAQVEEAKAGSRELDITIAKAFGWTLVLPHHFWRAPRGWVPLSLAEGVPCFTTSIDAALALVAKVLPGWTGRVSFGPPSTARLWHREYSDKTQASYDAPTPALAMIFSLLDALLQQSETAHVER